ncbi:MAG: hypothetical protein WD136_00855 [Cyanobium sp.]
MPLIIVGRSFIAAYVIAILSSIFPIRFADIGWQQQIIDTFVNAGTVPLTGRIFVLLAVLYKGYDMIGLSWDTDSSELPVLATSGLLAKRKIARLVHSIRRIKSNLHRLVVVYGPPALFVAVAILQIAVSARTFRALDADFLNQSTLLTRQTTQSRAALSASPDQRVLVQALQILVPEPERESASSLPPLQLRTDLLDRLDQRDSTLRGQLDLQRSQRFTQLVFLTIKNVLLALLFSFSLYWLRPAAVKSFLRSIK